ncbi:protein maelstrom homolog [Microcaecilia unicolor]|uniref:Protein maelstrom homolog n=1 Tax=Microcaecilia unicolor TaxID=1415580 RepID=A0A6P7YD30_9AMPH|nr:protein maelstrom homolog [Microcaecilia unicolor]
MPNKRSGRNGYFFFVLEKLPELQRRGLAVKGVRDAVPYCSADWQLLSQEEKEKYTEIARSWKAEQDKASKSNPPSTQTQQMTTMTSLGMMTLNTAANATEPGRTSEQCGLQPYPTMAEETFYFLNIFSHGELPPHCEQRFLPCEIGCVKYSLKEGVLASFHQFIDPGEIPRGFRFHCQASSDATHQIPLSGFELSTNRYHNLFCELCAFVWSNSRSNASVYCKSSDKNRVNWCLKWLAVKSGMENRLQLLNVEDLVVELYKCKLNEEPSKTYVQSLLDVFQWDYSSNTRCKWHQENDVLSCALAVCKKIAYCISNSLASVYGIPLTLNHLPLQDHDSNNTINPKMVVLDAGRFQKQKMQSVLCAHAFSSIGQRQGCVGKTGPPSGMQTPCIGRGRGIIRLLESIAASRASSG